MAHSDVIRASAIATEEIRKTYEAGGPIHGLHSRADIGILLAEIDALHVELLRAEKREIALRGDLNAIAQTALRASQSWRDA